MEYMLELYTIPQILLSIAFSMIDSGDSRESHKNIEIKKFSWTERRLSS